MKTIKEIFESKGIFTIFAENYSEQYNQIFGDVIPENLDMYAIFRWGNMQAVSNLTPENAPQIVVAYIAVKLTRWLALAKTYNANYTPLAVSRETRTKQGTLKTVGTSESTDLNAAKVFNDNDFVNDNKSTSNRDDSKTDTYDLTEIVERQGGAADLQNEIKIRRSMDLQNEIIADIIKELTLSIY